MADGPHTSATVRFDLVLDSQDPSKLAPFWAQALGYIELENVDNDVLLAPDGRPGPNLLVQQVPDTKSTKNRMHLDIYATDIEREAARLERLGASRVEQFSEHGSNWILMSDPEGNEFCVCRNGGDC